MLGEKLSDLAPKPAETSSPKPGKQDKNISENKKKYSGSVIIAGSGIYYVFLCIKQLIHMSSYEIKVLYM